MDGNHGARVRVDSELWRAVQGGLRCSCSEPSPSQERLGRLGAPPTNVGWGDGGGSLPLRPPRSLMPTHANSCHAPTPHVPRPLTRPC